MQKLPNFVIMIDYSVSNEPIFRKNYSDEIENLINSYRKKIASPYFMNYGKLQSLIKKYPEVPEFSNFLYAAYFRNEKHELARTVLNNTLKQHPDYLFARVNLAYNFLFENKLNEAKAIFKYQDDLHNLYPEWQIFQESEIETFHFFWFQCYAIEKNIEKAQQHFDILEKYVNNESLLNELRDILDTLKIIYYEVNKNAVDGADFDKTIQTTKEPIFEHAQIKELLYNNYGKFETDLVEQILSLPPDSLAKDLETALYDCIFRYEYYLMQAENEEDFPSNLATVTLAFMAETKQTSALPIIIKMFEQGIDFIDFWFEDFIFDDVALLTYELVTPETITALIEFIKTPERNTHIKSLATEVLSIYAQKKPEHQQKVVSILSDLLDFYLENRNVELIFDAVYLAHLVRIISELNLESLLPKAKLLFEKKMVSEQISGNENDYFEKFGQFESYYKNLDFTGVSDFLVDYHNDLNDIYFDEEDEDENFEEDADEHDNFQDKYINKVADIILKDNESETYQNVGRNDMCPCGSGKKFKKCCMK